MKYLVLILCLALSTASFADESTKAEYDELQQSAGKWGFISSMCFTASLLGLGTAYYALDKMGQYSDGETLRDDLTQEELTEYRNYDKMLKGGVGVAAGGLIFGLGAYGMSVGYERDANAHALKFKVEF